MPDFSSNTFDTTKLSAAIPEVGFTAQFSHLSPIRILCGSVIIGVFRTIVCQAKLRSFYFSHIYSSLSAILGRRPWRIAMHIRSRILPSICLLSTLALALSAAAQTVIDTFFIGTGPVAVAVNPKINKIYVANEWDGTVGIVNGLDDSVTIVTTGSRPFAFAVNSISNQVYVVNEGDDTVSVIDASNNTWPINVGSYPTALDFDSVRNRIYVANTSDNTVSVIDGLSNLVIATITVRNQPEAIAVNSVTGKVYVANSGENTVSVIDGNNLNAAPSVVLVGQNPSAVAVNSLTNKIYVINGGDTPGTVSVIDGPSNKVKATVTVGNQPGMLGLDAATNQIYVAVHYDSDVAMIDGATNNVSFISLPDYPATLAVERSTNKIYVLINGNEAIMIDGLTRRTFPVVVGNDPEALAINESTNRIYVANYGDNTVSVIAGASATPAQFVPVNPCRLVDTRPQKGGGGPIQGGTFQNFYIPQEGGCNIPITAVAYSLNVTVVSGGAPLGYLSIWPTGQDQPGVCYHELAGWPRQSERGNCARRLSGRYQCLRHRHNQRGSRC